MTTPYPLDRRDRFDNILISDRFLDIRSEWHDKTRVCSVVNWY